MNRQRRFSEEIADLLLDKIREWGLEKGDKLPSHSKLVAELHVSLPSLREGLELLSLSGLIRITHGAGTIVSEPGPQDYFRTFNLASRISSVNPEDLSALLKFLSGKAQETLLDPPGIVMDALDELCRLDESADTDRFLDAYERFHLGLAMQIGNPLIREIYLIGLNLLFTHPAMKDISSSGTSFFIQSHKNLKHGIESGKGSELTGLIKDCYNLDILMKESVSFVYESFGSGSPGGSFYSIASRIAKTLNEKSAVNIQIELTGGGIENIKLTEEGKTILGLTQSDIADSAFKGKGIFDKKYSHLRAICRMRPLDLWIMTGERSGIESLYDFKGRRIAMGAAGGDSGIISRRILENLGFSSDDYRAYFLPVSNAVDGLSRGEIDLVFYLSCGVPAVISRYMENFPMNIIPVPSEVLDMLESENSYWKRSVITDPPDFSGTDTISVSSLLITGSWVSESLVYRITRELIENCEEIDSRFTVNPGEISIPLHKGAEKAIREVSLV